MAGVHTFSQNREHTMQRNRIIALSVAALILGAMPALSDDDRDDDDDRGRERGTMHQYGGGYGYDAKKIDGRRVRTTPLTKEDVETLMKAQLVWRANPNLKVGNIEVTGEHTMVAEIVTKEGSLVQRFEFDIRTGRHHPIR